MTWDTAEDMFEARPHGDIIPVFDPSVVRTLRRTHAGDHRVIARFDGLEQAVDLDHLDDHTRHVAVGATGPFLAARVGSSPNRRRRRSPSSGIATSRSDRGERASRAARR